MPTHKEDVKLVRWPAEAASLDGYRAAGVLRLLVVEGQAEPPITNDVKEDWVRPPVSRTDLAARIASLRAKAEVHAVPRVDPGGVLRYGAKSVAVSPVGTELLTRLVRDFGVLVSRTDLQRCLQNGCGERNALDLQIMRLRRRIAPLGLVIRTAWGRGYVLVAEEPADDDEPTIPTQDRRGSVAASTSDRPRRRAALTGRAPARRLAATATPDQS